MLHMYFKNDKNTRLSVLQGMKIVILHDTTSLQNISTLEPQRLWCNDLATSSYRMWRRGITLGPQLFFFPVNYQALVFNRWWLVCVCVCEACMLRKH